MGESLKEQLRLLQQLFDAKLDPISRDLTTIKREVTGSCKRITALEKYVNKLKNRNENKRSRAESRLKRWHIWAVIVAAGIYAAAMIAASLL